MVTLFIVMLTCYITWQLSIHEIKIMKLSARDVKIDELTSTIQQYNQTISKCMYYRYWKTYDLLLKIIE